MRDMDAGSGEVLGALPPRAPRPGGHPPRWGRALALGALGLVLSLLAAGLHAQELPFTHYSTESEINPLPTSGITVVLQDHLGFLWFAAYGSGLVQYDGVALRTYGFEDSLKTRGVRALAEDGAGRLWAGSGSGLFVSERPLGDYPYGERIHFASQIGGVRVQDGAIGARGHLIADGRGWIWAASQEAGLVRYRVDGAETVSADTIALPLRPGGEVERVRALASRRDGTVWAALASGRIAVMEGATVASTLWEGAPCALVIELYEAPSGTLWGGCQDGTIWALDEDGGGRTAPAPRATYGGRITVFAEDQAGALWVGGLGGGLMRIPAGEAEPRTYTRQQGLLDDSVWGVIHDREGNHWIAQNSGLSKLRADFEAFGHYTGRSYAEAPPLLPALDVDSVLPPELAGDGLLVAGTSGGVALIRGRDEVHYLTAAQGLSSNIVLGLCRDQRADLWIATRDGLNHLSFAGPAAQPPGAAARRSLTLFGRRASLARFDLGSVGACRLITLPATGGRPEQEGLCFAADIGVLCLIGGRWYRFAEASGLPEGGVGAMMVDALGHLYASARDNRLYRSVAPITAALLDTSTVPAASRFPMREVAVPLFAPMSRGAEGGDLSAFVSAAWVGPELWTAGNGITVHAGEPLQVVARLGRDEGFDANANGIAYDPRSRAIWVGTERGLVEVDATSRTIRRWITRLDGLVGNVAWGPDAVVLGGDGALYFATSTGLSIYRPHLDRPNAVAPVPRLRRVYYAEDRSGHNELSLEYAALSFGNEKKVRYRSRLLGYEHGWSDETAATSVRYTNLGAFLVPRSYTFELTAANEDGVWSEEPLSYTLTVQPPWWLRWWAFLGYGLLAVAGAGGMDRAQRRRLIRREREGAHLREKELRAEAAEAWASYLEAENRRQVQELEQARRLQLSMLPRAVPEHPLLEIAAYMETATEVGGDYYDFHLGADGTLTLAIGDATGHGLSAGTMVTAMKSLWSAFAQEPDLEAVLHCAAAALRQMYLPGLYMALALARYRAPTLEFVGAGMPPAILYRAATGAVEVVPLRGIPLGGPSGGIHDRRCLQLAAGDTVVLMSDGFPELQGASGARLGYEEAVEIAAAVAGRPPQAVIDHLAAQVRAWCGTRRPDDDVTFLVLRVREPA